MYVKKHSRLARRARGRMAMGDAYGDCVAKCPSYTSDMTDAQGSAIDACFTACDSSATAADKQTAATTSGITGAAASLAASIFGGGGVGPVYGVPQSGMDTTTVLLLGAIGLGLVYVIVKD